MRSVRAAAPRRSTVADVARNAGVSPSTVSRALSGRGYVSADVRGRIDAAVLATEYVPDFNARNLRSGARSDIGVLISDLRNPFYAELAIGIEQRLRAAGLLMFLVNTDGDAAQELAAVRMFAALRIPGVVATPVSREGVAELRRRHIVVVQADRMINDPAIGAVTSDNVLGGRLATEHLVGLGHRSIAMVIDEDTWTTGAGRLAGYRSTLEAAGVPFDPGLVLITGLHQSTRDTGLVDLLAARPEVTAAVVANNVLGQGVFAELTAARISIPGRLSLVAIDDVPWMSMVTPPITAVAQHPTEIGRLSADLLITQLPARQRTRLPDTALSARSDGPATHLEVPPTLIVRKSSVRRSLPRAVAGTSHPVTPAVHV